MTNDEFKILEQWIKDNGLVKVVGYPPSYSNDSGFFLKQLPEASHHQYLKIRESRESDDFEYAQRLIEDYKMRVAHLLSPSWNKAVGEGGILIYPDLNRLKELLVRE
jgi:hypothetical protein